LFGRPPESAGKTELHQDKWLLTAQQLYPFPIEHN